VSIESEKKYIKNAGKIVKVFKQTYRLQLKQCTIILFLIPWFFLFISGSVFSQENLKQHKFRQDKIVEKIMDLSNRQS